MKPVVDFLKKGIDESQFIEEVQKNYYEMIQVYKEARE